MNSNVEFHIRQNYSWSKLPANIKQLLANSPKEYEKCVISFSVRNQLRHKGNLVRSVKKDEKRYYEELVQYSREHLMLFPYHLSDVIVKGMRITPFQYYCNIMQDLMEQERSYDSLPNFTAADCLRLLGIGRNQYIDLMNQCRSAKRFFRRKPVRDLLPLKPVADINIEPWWVVQIGYITEDDIKMVTESEKRVIDKIIDDGCQKAGDLDAKDVYTLYSKGLVYLDVPIYDDDYIIVPPLEGFVMNRVLGDYFETLLYKIFVSIDEHTPVAELANVLQIDPSLVKNAVSMYCRLGFARRKNQDTDSEYHPSWRTVKKTQTKTTEEDSNLLIDWTITEKGSSDAEITSKSPDSCSLEEQEPAVLQSSSYAKRIAFLFDSTLTAFLMMGNLSPGLKSHAVTMFEVGKLSDESLDSFLQELDKVADVGEGEAQRYFDHALTLRSTITFLRHNKELCLDSETPGASLGLDLIRCESLQNLEPATCARLLNKNYALLVSMAPLSNEIRPVASCYPPHLGPAIPEVSSVWFKLYIYSITKCGPPTLLLVKGTRLRKLPKVFRHYDRLLITTWGHDPGVIPTSNVLLTLNDALTHSAVLVQAFGLCGDGETVHVPFPFDQSQITGSQTTIQGGLSLKLQNHFSVECLSHHLDLTHMCGYVTMLRLSGPGLPAPPGIQVSSPRYRADEGNLTSTTHTPNKEASPSLRSSPVNGFKDASSADVLADELDRLNTKENVSLGSGEPHATTASESGSKKEMVLELYQKNEYCEQLWTLLDCCFGMPLFDAQLNQDICQRIMNHSLCSKDSLQLLTMSSRKLTLGLLSFIAEIQDVKSADSSLDGSSCSFKKHNEDLPHPVKNLLFSHGKLEPWNGK